MTDWQNAVVVDPKELNRLQNENAKLGGTWLDRGA